MENSLIVLIFIGSIIYKLYSNYKEEMEKSKKRNVQKRPLAPVESYPSSTPSFLDKTKELEVNRSFSNTSHTTPQLDKRSKITIEKVSIKEEEVLQTELLEFDLKQAVLQSAILERPYQ